MGTNWDDKIHLILEANYLTDPEDEHPISRKVVSYARQMGKRLARAEKEAAALKAARKLLSDLEFWLTRCWAVGDEGFDKLTINRVRKMIVKIDAATKNE